MSKKINDMKLNESVATKDTLPGFEGIMGENMKLVGVSYHLLGDSDILQEVKVWAKGFDPKRFDD